MGIASEILQAVRQMSALERRTEDVAHALERITTKVENLLERMARLEQKQDLLRESVTNEILADLKGEMMKTQMMVDMVRRDVGTIRPSLGGDPVAPAVRFTPPDTPPGTGSDHDT